MSCSSILRVATVHTREMDILEKEDGKTELSGTEGTFLNLILETLDLQLKIVIAEDSEWGRLLPNGSWTGMVGKVYMNKADIAINLIGVTESRMRVVDYSTVYLTDDITFAIEKQGFASTSSALTRPFGWTIWTTMVVVLLLMPLLIRFILQTKDNYLHGLLKMFGGILKQPFSSIRDSFRHRIFMMSWLIYAMIMSFSYSSVLLSILTVPSVIPTVRNFKELSDAVVTKNYKAFFNKGTFHFEQLRNHEKKSYRMLAEYVSHNSWWMGKHPILFTPEINKQSAMATAKTILEVAAGPEEWKWNFLSDDSIMVYNFAIVINKGFCHKKRLNKVVSRVNSAGIYKKIMSDEIFQTWLPHPERRRILDKAIRPLSINDLHSAFVLYSFGIGISFLVFIIENICARYI